MQVILLYHSLTDTSHHVPMLREIRSDAEELCAPCKHHGINVSRHLLTGTKTDSVFLNMNKMWYANSETCSN